MPPIPNVINKVPMMYRAQVTGRCQLQRLVRADEQDAQRWTKEWTERTYPHAPQFGQNVQTRTYQISWRFVTNAGQDDGIIRPVMGAKGWPFYPGSSMKGLFRSACNSQQKKRYCGYELSNGDMAPGILRFHGGYPTNKKWVEKTAGFSSSPTGLSSQKRECPSCCIYDDLFIPAGIAIWYLQH